MSELALSFRPEDALGGTALLKSKSPLAEANFLPGAVVELQFRDERQLMTGGSDLARWTLELSAHGLAGTGGNQRLDVLPGIGIGRFTAYSQAGVAIHGGPAFKLVNGNLDTGLFLSATGYIHLYSPNSYSPGLKSFLKPIVTIYPQLNEYSIALLVGVSVF